MWSERARNGVRSTIEQLVHCTAAGEHTLAKKNLPPIVHVIKRALAEAVAAEISSVAMEDVSGQQFMHRTAAVELADRVIVGDIQVADFVAASRDLLGAAAPPKGSLRDLQDGFTLLHRAMSAVMQRVFTNGHDAGLQLIDRRVRVTATSSIACMGSDEAKTYTATLGKWLQRVLDTWYAEMVAFRVDESLAAAAKTPAVAACIEQSDEFYKFNQLVAKLQPILTPPPAGTQPRAAPAKPKRPRHQRADTPSPVKRGRGKGNKKGKGKFERMLAVDSDADDESEEEGADTPSQPQRTKSNATSGVWPDRPTFSSKGYKKMQGLVKAKFPKSCVFHLLGKCKNSAKDCKFSHDSPKGFVKWAEEACPECTESDE